MKPHEPNDVDTMILESLYVQYLPCMIYGVGYQFRGRVPGSPLIISSTWDMLTRTHKTLTRSLSRMMCDREE